MRKSATEKKAANGHSRKQKYERTTPVGRAIKHIEKALGASRFAISRLRSWCLPKANVAELDTAITRLEESEASLMEAETAMNRLFARDWSPPPKRSSVEFKVGEEVMIAAKYLDKYSQIYPLQTIANLSVCKLLDTGEIGVRYGATMFLASKSHLEKRRHGKVKTT